MNRQHTKIFPWFFFLLGVSFYFLSYFLQMSPSVMKSQLMNEFSLNGASFGNLAAFFFYAYGLMQLPVGILFDRFGIKKTLGTAMIICVLGTALFGLSDGFGVASLGRILMGIGCAFAPIACMTIIGTYFQEKYFAMLAGLMLTIGMLGGVAGEAPFSMMIGELGWRHAIFILAIICVVIAALVWMAIPNSKQKSEQASKSLFSGLKNVISNRQTWLISLYAGLMFMAIPGFAGLWGTSFIQVAYHLSGESAAEIVSLIFIGFAIGSPFFGWLSDYSKRRKLPMYLAAIFSLVTISVVIYIPNLSLFTLRLLMLAIGFFSSGFTTALAATREVNQPDSSATALGMMNLVNTFLGAAPQPIIGLILDYFWMGKVATHGVRHFSIQTYHLGLSVFPIGFAIALFLLFFVKETHCEQIQL